MRSYKCPDLSPIHRLLPEIVCKREYGIWGGVARYALACALGVQPKLARDIDLFRIDPNHRSIEPSRELNDRDQQLQLQLAPEDYRNGAKISVFGLIEDVIGRTDLAINEVAIFDGLIYATDRCADDLRMGLIRAGNNPSNWRPYDGYDGISGRVLLKAMRFVAEAADEEIHYQVVKKSFRNPRMTRFHWLLELSKVLGHSAVVGRTSSAPRRFADMVLAIPPFSDKGEGPLFSGDPLEELLYRIGPQAERDLHPWKLKGLPEGMTKRLLERVQREIAV